MAFTPRLIVNADDLGYTPGVNRAIVELHRAGPLTSATLMATGMAFEDALAGLPAERVRRGSVDREAGALGIGCHVVLVDGVSVLPGKDLPALGRVDPGQPARPGSSFRPTLVSFVADLLRGRIPEAEIEREAIAQIRLLQARGVRVTHLDTHKHTHMFPRVLRPLLRAALQCGVGAVRNPFEPAWSLRATPGTLLVRRAEVRLLRLLRPEFTRLVAEAGLRTTAGAIGVLSTGTLDAATLERLLHAATRESKSAETTWELVCHPGYVDAALAVQPTRLQASREMERAALAAAGPTLQGFRLIHFGQLSEEPGPSA